MKTREVGERCTYVTAADVVLLVDTDHFDWVTSLERYEAETFPDVLLAVKRLLDQINL